MQRISLAILGVIAATTAQIQSSWAADILYSRQSAAYWTGGYFGVNVGYGWAKLSESATGGGTTVSGSENLNGWVIGLQSGYNWQIGQFVWGTEVDFQATGQKNTVSLSNGGTSATFTDKLPWFGTARLRAGVAVDRFLPYVTGGVAYGEFRSEAVAVGAFTGSYSYSTVRAGWVLGGGVEGMISNNFTWRIEYLHLDTGTVSSSASVGGTAVTSSYKFTDDIVRLGINYKAQ